MKFITCPKCFEMMDPSDPCCPCLQPPTCVICDGFGFVRPEKRNLSSSDYCDCEAGKRIAKSDQSFLGEYLTEKE